MPYLKALNVPPWILKRLTKVFMKSPNDLLTDEDLLGSGSASQRKETMSVVLAVLFG